MTGKCCRRARTAFESGSGGLCSWPPVCDGGLNSSLDPHASPAESKRCNHFIDDLVIGPQLAIRSDPTQYLGQPGRAVLIDGCAYPIVGLGPRFSALIEEACSRLFPFP
jgi:hypothetical protein